MATLLLRLAAPLQSWGTDSKFEKRRTEYFPTKSGILGMAAAAMGRSRDADIEDLARLHVGVRADRPGTLVEDYHTARDGKTTYVTRRYYLSDAVFLAGIESESREQLEEIQAAIKAPVFPLFLGRRSCPPTLPIVLGISDLPLLDALKETPPLVDSVRGPLRIYIEGRWGRITKKIYDQPVSYDIRSRQYESRLVSEVMSEIPGNNDRSSSDEFLTDLDIFSAIGGDE